jgi:hypothetical protein
MVSMARYECTSRKVDMEASTRAISITAMAFAMRLKPCRAEPTHHLL